MSQAAGGLTYKHQVVAIPQAECCNPTYYSNPLLLQFLRQIYGPIRK